MGVVATRPGRDSIIMSAHQLDASSEKPSVHVAAPGQLRIVLCGVPYAANLGDAVIADCMAYALRKQQPAARICHLDLSTRDGYGKGGVTGKKRILSLLRNLPRFLSDPMASVGLSLFLARRAVPAWQNYFEPGDVVIIGGGHLLSDFNLNFPRKLDLLSSFAHAAGANLAMHGVGVSARWSNRAGQLFENVLSRCAAISVRDEQSALNLKRHLPRMGISPRLGRDPGYLAHLAYASVAAKGTGVGLNLSNPDELAQYAGNRKPRQDYDDFWLHLIKSYLGRGLKVTLFTNGAEEDEDYVDHIVGKANYMALSGFERMARPKEPSDLVARIKGLDLMIGHRLHAQIVAFTHGIPSIALGWDDKLRSQMELMGRADFLLPFADPDPNHVLRLGDRALGQSVDTELVHRLSREAYRDVASTLDALIDS
jgi:polysaccharide pyruvyl transferase WcaK-like protein